MANEPAYILAEVTLISHPDALRFGTAPITSRPTILDVGPVQFSSQALIEDRSAIRPGATLTVPFCLTIGELALKDLPVGAEFTMWEYRHVGKGRVIKVLSSKQYAEPNYALRWRMDGSPGICWYLMGIFPNGSFYGDILDRFERRGTSVAGKVADWHEAKEILRLIGSGPKIEPGAVFRATWSVLDKLWPKR